MIVCLFVAVVGVSGANEYFPEGVQLRKLRFLRCAPCAVLFFDKDGEKKSNKNSDETFACDTFNLKFPLWFLGI